MKKIIVIFMAAICTLIHASEPGASRYRPIAAPAENPNTLKAYDTYDFDPAVMNSTMQKPSHKQPPSESPFKEITYTIINNGNETYHLSILAHAYTLKGKQNLAPRWQGTVKRKKQIRVKHGAYDKDNNTVILQIESRSRKGQPPFQYFITPQQESIITIEPNNLGNFAIHEVHP